MTTEFDDELLSAVLDGEADPQTVAAVQADPDAARRLTALEAASALVATPPAPATPERRAASIAAALAAAQPAPEVTSLSVARERKTAAAAPKRRQVNWLAVAAAFAFVLISAVVITGIVGGSNSADVVDTATEAADDAADATETAESFGTADSTAMAESATADDADEAVEDAMEEAMEEEEAMEDDAMEEESMDAEDAMEDDDSETALTTTTVTAERSIEPFATNNLLLLEEAIDLGVVVPVLQPTDPELLDVVNLDCLNPELPPDIDQFAFAELGEFAPPPQLVVVQFDPFDPSQVILIFDAEDCTPVG